MIRVSVCMATYNGAPYIRQQLSSILNQIGADDEIVICDDASSDETCALIEEYSDSRIKLFRNIQKLGHVQNFARAISLASGRVIALSDQDDVWADARLDRMMGLLATLPPYSLVVGEFAEITAEGKPIRSTASIGESPKSMYLQLMKIFLGRARYFGCTFLFHGDLKRFILPIPPLVEAHDLWIAMNACLHGRIVHCRPVTLMRRIHGNNLTPSRRRTLLKIVRSRLIYMYYCCLGKFK